MHKQFNLSASPLALAALTVSFSVVADAVKAQTTVQSQPATSESQLIREVGNDPLNVRVSQPVAQVTSVSQLSDVRPTDWAFTALQSLVERYNCIAGYPDRTFRGQRAMTRFEFAAGLNACLDKINEVIATGLADKVGRDDLEAIARLQEDFAAELASLRARVDSLDTRTATLERQQFSTTTRLTGEVIFAAIAANDGLSIPSFTQPNGVVIPNPPPLTPLDLRPPADPLGGQIPGIGETRFTPAPRTAGAARTGIDSTTNIAFGTRARLNFDTSFTGTDLLRTRLQVDSVSNPGVALGSGNSVRPGFGAGDNRADTNAQTFIIDDFFYRFNVGDTRVFIGPKLDPNDVFNTFSPVASSGQGSPSRFGRYPVALRIGGTTTAIAADFRLNPQANLILFYGQAAAAGVLPATQGLFGGGNSKLGAQIAWRPAPNFDLGFTYSFDYLLGSSLATSTNTAGEILPGVASFTANTLLGNLRWRFAPRAEFFVWGSASFANSQAPAAAAPGGTSGTFTSWMTGFAFPDLINRGDNFAIMFGQPFYLSSFTGPAAINPFTSTFYTTPYHLEAFYNFRLTPNITITPGVFFVFNPNNDTRNGTATVGVIRSTFSF